LVTSLRSSLNVVITELDGLKVNPAPLGPAAAEAVTFIEQALQARKLRVVTQQGNSLSNLALRSQQLSSKNSEDGISNIDSFIIQAVKDQAEQHTGKLPTAEKAVLVTGDRSMRVIAKAKGVLALTEGDLRKAIFKKSEKPRQNHSKKKSKG
jgi:predicted ribonuclease YlaK